MNTLWLVVMSLWDPLVPRLINSVALFVGSLIPLAPSIYSQTRPQLQQPFLSTSLDLFLPSFLLVLFPPTSVYIFCLYPFSLPISCPSFSHSSHLLRPFAFISSLPLFLSPSHHSSFLLSTCHSYLVRQNQPYSLRGLCNNISLCLL